MNIKKILLFLALVLLIAAGCRTKKALIEVQTAADNSRTETSGTDFSEQSTWLLGYFNPERLALPPYSEWYIKGFDEYKPDGEVIPKLAATPMDSISIQIVMGTWCPDSRREVPRFMKILSLIRFPPEKITFIGVDNEKLSPVGGFEQLDIQRVPTFIFYKNKIETGRIIENPSASLEKDMLNILTGNE